MQDQRTYLQNFFLSLIAIFVCFFLLETASRVYVNNFANEKLFFLYASLNQLEAKAKREGSGSFKKMYHRYLGYFLTPNYVKGANKHNSLGYRGEEIEIPKPAGEFRIACLGGSTTYSSGVDDYRKSYPDLLERELIERGFDRVSVINAGTPGWSSWESLINFQFRVLDLEPDLIIVYHGINDVHPRLVWPPTAYRGDNSGRSLPAATSVFMPSILEYSTLIRILMVRAGVSRPHIDVNKTIDRRASTFYADDFQSQKMRGKYPKGIFKKVSAQQMLETNKPIFFERNIENIVRIAQGKGIKAILATFAVSPFFENEPRASSPEYLFAYADQNATIRKIAQRTEAWLFDFAESFPKDKKYYHDGRHVNEQGSFLKAKMFADFVVEKQLMN